MCARCRSFIKIIPAYKTSLLVEEGDTKPFAKSFSHLGLHLTVYSPYYELVNTDLVNDAKHRAWRCSLDGKQQRSNSAIEKDGC